MITTSVFDLFKIGPGPSSSHTIGPMKAAFDFVQRLAGLPPDQLAKADSIHIHLYGSLSATGKGHGTDRAIVAGLLGWQPETTDPEALNQLLRDPAITYPVQVGDRTFPISAASFYFERVRYESPHANTMVLKLTGAGDLLTSEEYYSIGGGFIIRKGDTADANRTITVPYPYNTMKELKAHLSESGLP
ncbi:MAG TPA: serine dehydratase beta chain, partial [Fibrella sp.]